MILGEVAVQADLAQRRSAAGSQAVVDQPADLTGGRLMTVGEAAEALVWVSAALPRSHAGERLGLSPCSPDE